VEPINKGAYKKNRIKHPRSPPKTACGNLHNQPASEANAGTKTELSAKPAGRRRIKRGHPQQLRRKT
jgi:hypothetical protein